ncbi:acyl-CoA-binding protein [Flammeovirga kamogawensis]|uniref:Acyl-CoA-binding protein n=1 Tax=Flammeovirga kamogawensis TaxID=373891 RepID=A0ABX8GW78_9BACT|nr:acyl-CoA-binding protein [Flammeovirga kamogawensis]MBB6461636.1 diazepam-binding inhibitor (GABA receptor modulating acyl-CoA-binding protein) [Flammeovirga kamogawensis]QWG07437.1 acyl-CoA-binding protein [Flammeovirga kamogawensis]TRX69248.1 acyl-CoA-binding protein [Flammeovirga kamogawensis]
MASEAFKDAQERVNQLPAKPSNDHLLQLYALFKQASVGDVNTERPGGFDFKGNAKWDAWKKIEGTSTSDAEAQYVALVNELEG